MLDSTILRSERIDERWTMVAVTFDVAPDPVREAIRGVVLRALERQRTSGCKAVPVVDCARDVGAR
jgi:hypothetical protein